LKAALTADLEKSMEILLSKTVRESRDLYANYVSLTYQNAMRASTVPEFEKALSRFESILDQILILANLEQEVGSMTSEFVSKATKLGTRYDPPIPKLLETSTLAATLPSLIEEVIANRNPNLSAISEKWRVSPTIVKSISDTLDNMPKLIIPLTMVPSRDLDASNTTKQFLNFQSVSRANPESYRDLGFNFDQNDSQVVVPITA
jgi:hypothetical protein